MLMLATLLPYRSFANMREFATTRLHSTAGAGVASILLEEATILNPAPLAFFNISSIYIQKDSPTLRYDEDNLNEPVGDPDLWGIFASDAKGSVKGSFSYQKHRHHQTERRRYSFSAASPVGKQSALGLTYRKTKDHNSFTNKDKSYDQLVIGIIHSLSDNFSLGFIFADPFKSNAGDTTTALGAQYVYKNFLSLILDLGANIYEELSETAHYHAAIQFQLFSDFYARFGLFQDNGKESSGSGVGLSWIQPKLSLGVSLRNTELKESIPLQQFNEKIRELSFSLSYRF